MEGGFIERNWFAFKMLDGDKDGYLGAQDLCDIRDELMSPVCSKESVFNAGTKTLYQCKCAFSSEINTIYEYYFNTKLIKRQPRQQ